MQIKFAFGKSGLTLDLPKGPQYQLVSAHTAPAIPDLETALSAALDAPIGCAPLAELAAGKRTAAISVCDITRPAPNRLTLPPILARLEAAGMAAEDIMLCIATGLHRQATQNELDTILGPEIAGRYPILNHDAKDRASHTFLGTTTRGTPVWIATRFLEADLHITLGFIEQHLMLGFSGGRKLIAPGLAFQETIKVIHSSRFMREALAVEGSVEHNPIHADLLEIAALARHDFMLDVTLSREREITGIFAGNAVQAHASGVEFLRRTSIEHVAAPVDAAITSAAGFPLDLNLYQTVKGVTAVQHIVKPGGPILILSECSEGVGSPEFAARLATWRDPQTFLDDLADTPVVVDQWQLEKLALVALRHPLYFYMPGADRTQLAGLAAQTLPTPQAAVAALLAGLPPKATIALVPDGPYACARVKAS